MDIRSASSNDLESLLRCPICKGSLIKHINTFHCKVCMEDYPIKNNIIYFSKSEIQQSSFFKKEWRQKLRDTKDYNLPNINQKFDLSQIKRYTLPLNNKVLLDAGCGTGLSTLPLLSQGAQILFLDIIPESLDFIQMFIRNRKISGNFLLIVADLNNIPIITNSVDIVWSGGVLEHFKSIKRPYLEIYRVLKENGDLIFSIPNKFGLQRFLSSIKKSISKKYKNHYETGFIFYHLKNLFPAKYFSSYNIEVAGIGLEYYNLIMPFLKTKLPKIFFLFFKYSIYLFSSLFFTIKLAASWFLLYGKKKMLRDDNN